LNITERGTDSVNRVQRDESLWRAVDHDPQIAALHAEVKRVWSSIVCQRSFVILRNGQQSPVFEALDCKSHRSQKSSFAGERSTLATNAPPDCIQHGTAPLLKATVRGLAEPSSAQTLSADADVA
jgi:hypothetical protein